MGDRTPFAQRVDEDLQDFVDRVDEHTNLSKADVMDEALRRLRDASRITEDGQFIVDGDYGETAVDGGEITKKQLLDNQQKMMRLLSSSPTLSEGEDPYTNDLDGDDGGVTEVSGVPDVPDEKLPQPTDTERRIAELAGEYAHEETLDPEKVEEIDTQESDVVSHTKRYLCPAILGMINHRVENSHSDRIEWADIREIMRTRLDVSRGSLYNYRDKLVASGGLIPHPSYDDSVVSDEDIEEARAVAASVVDKREWMEIDVKEMKSLKQERYTDDPDEYIGQFISDWPSETYYVDEDVYREEVWEMISEAVIEIAVVDPDTTGYRPDRDKGKMYPKERAAGASSFLASIVESFGVEEEELLRVVGKARGVESEEDFEECGTLWGDVSAVVEDELNGDEYDADVREVFSEVIGVDPAEKDEEELLAAYKEWVKSNHPDADGDAEEIDREEFGRVARAKDEMLG